MTNEHNGILFTCKYILINNHVGRWTRISGQFHNSLPYTVPILTGKGSQEEFGF